jgi:8-oxo-dGTP pyrophosphatase MutT (NUDIX family)/ribosomal protein S18 acetylase RimI-like enzyme
VSSPADDVRTTVAGRVPVDEREARSIERILLELDRLDRPFDEDADPVHVTGSAIIVGPRGTLMLRHRLLGIWVQPGGHIDAGEQPWEGAAREAFEETGLHLRHPADGPRLVHVDVHTGGRGHTHLDLRYLLLGGAADPAPPPGESQEIGWYDWVDAIALADDGLRGALVVLAAERTLTVRRATERDAWGIAEVFLRARAFALPSVKVVHGDDDVRAWWRDAAIARYECWVAVDGRGEVAAILALDLGGGPEGWIEHLYVDPSWIGQGVGDLLLSRAKQERPGGLRLWTFQVNGPARRFYLRHGFVEVELTDGAGNEEGEPDVRCEWRPDVAG